MAIMIDGSDATAAAIKRYTQAHGTTIAIRQVKYLNNIVEQDHRAVTRMTRPRVRFQACDAAQSTLVGIALIPMIKKHQLAVEEGDEGLTTAAWFSSLAA
jgi:putative transposase